MAKKHKKDSLPEGARLIARNRRALRDYDITERVEAGIVLLGSEVKSLREGKATIADGYVEFRKGEAWLIGIQINEYAWAHQFNHDIKRTRKLLLHRQELRKLAAKVSQKGFSIVPLALYFNGSKVKVDLGIGKGRREYEKRAVKAAKVAEREIDRELKRRR